MPVEVILPKVDMDMESATIESWKVKEGDRVARGDLLFEIVTAKSAMEVEAPASGVIGAIVGKTGEPIPVGSVVALIFGEGEEASRDAPAPTREAVAPRAVSPPKPPPPAPARSPAIHPLRAAPAFAGVRATPLARKVARDLDIDLHRIAGTGPLGRISEQDVRAFAPERDGRLVPFDAVRRIAATRLAESMRNAPHFHMTAEIDMGAFDAALARLRRAAVAARSVKPSPTVYLAFLAARALTKHPLLTASAEGHATRFHDRVDIAIAVEHDGALYTPVMRSCDTKSPADLAADFKRLSEALRDRTLKPADLTGGTFTISKLAMYGVDSFTAIINPPQGAILAVGRTVEKPVGRKGKIELRPMANFTLSSDHRIIDGATAARFMADLRAAVEKPPDEAMQGCAGVMAVS